MSKLKAEARTANKDSSLRIAVVRNMVLSELVDVIGRGAMLRNANGLERQEDHCPTLSRRVMSVELWSRPLQLSKSKKFYILQYMVVIKC